MTTQKLPTFNTANIGYTNHSLTAYALYRLYPELKIVEIRSELGKLLFVRGLK